MKNQPLDEIDKVELNVMRQTVKILEATQKKINDVFMAHPRVTKLMMKNKFFIVVAIDEPYFLNTYLKIRKYEMIKGRWTEEDENRFKAAENEWLEMFDVFTFDTEEWADD